MLYNNIAGIEIREVVALFNTPFSYSNVSSVNLFLSSILRVLPFVIIIPSVSSSLITLAIEGRATPKYSARSFCVIASLISDLSGPAV